MPDNAPAPPTPPAPPPPPQLINRNTAVTVVPAKTSEDEVEECLQRCLLSGVAKDGVRIRNVVPILQNGPTCGPVALAMLLGNNAEDLVELAREQHFTNNGEMFSCQDMVKLAIMATRKLSIKFDFILQYGDLCSEAVVKELLQGAALLVPYDADFNHTPCLKRGHKAHWALVIGIVDQADNPTNTYVFARHGKSAHLTLWKLSDLAASNANLIEFPPQRECDGLEYVVPVGGLAGENGLCSQFIIVKG